LHIETIKKGVLMSNKQLEKNMKQVLAGLNKMRDDQEAKEYQTLWGNISVPFTLREGMNRFKKYELDDIRKNLHIQGVSSLKKAELIEVLEERITALDTLLLLWDAERIGWLIDIAKNGGFLPAGNMDREQVRYFRKTGVIYSGSYKGQEVLAVPEELIQPIKKLASDSMFMTVIKKNTEWLKLTRGILYYYGTLSFPTLIEMLEKYTGESLPLRQYLDVMHEAKSYRKHNVMQDEEGFSNGKVLDSKRVKQEHKLRSNLEFYPFTKEQLLAAGEPDFVDRNQSYVQLVNYFLNHFNVERVEAEHFAEECVYATKIGEGPNEVMAFLSKSFELDSLEAARGVMDHVVQLMNNTRQWFLKGHTPLELSNKERSPQQLLPSSGATQKNEAVKVGRNEPCPCGSGKKSKKCCGR
jgi:hypothetical protein